MNRKILFLIKLFVLIFIISCNKKDEIKYNGSDILYGNVTKDMYVEEIKDEPTDLGYINKITKYGADKIKNETTRSKVFENNDLVIITNEWDKIEAHIEKANGTWRNIDLKEYINNYFNQDISEDKYLYVTNDSLFRSSGFDLRPILIFDLVMFKDKNKKEIKGHYPFVLIYNPEMADFIPAIFENIEYPAFNKKDSRGYIKEIDFYNEAIILQYENGEFAVYNIFNLETYKDESNKLRGIFLKQVKPENFTIIGKNNLIYWKDNFDLYDLSDEVLELLGDRNNILLGESIIESKKMK